LKYIIGLGNPGAQYETTRHNVGFLLLDHLAEKLNITLKPKNRLFDIGFSVFKDLDVALVRPLTFMNLSGNAVKYILDVEKAAKDDLLILYDDFHLPLGKIRLRPQGSDAGHNGIKNITAMISSDEYQRLRIGIDSSFFLLSKQKCRSFLHFSSIIK
jgi:PTH1 family peptidyl-tRNA hydrolase